MQRVISTNIIKITHGLGSAMRQQTGLVRILPLIIIIVGFGMRVDGLSRFSFWYDESLQAYAGLSSTLSGVFTVVRSHYGASPLDYIITWLTYRLVGDSEFALRFMPLCWSTITIALVYQCGNALQKRLGIWAAFYIAVSWIAIRYAQELRFYSLGLMLGCLTVAIAISAAKDAKRRNGLVWGLVVLVAAATLYTHVYSFLLCVAGIAILFLCAKGSTVRASAWYCSALFVASLLFLPWFMLAFNITSHPAWATQDGLAKLTRTLLGYELINPENVPTTFVSLIFPTLTLIFGAAGVLLSLSKNKSACWLRGLVFALAAATLFVVFNNLVTRAVFHQRHFVFLLPERALLVGVGIQAFTRLVKPTYARQLLLLALCFGLLVSSQTIVKTDTRRQGYSYAASVATYLADHARVDTNSAWFIPKWRHITVDYYLRRHGIESVNWQSTAQDSVSESDVVQMKAAPNHSIIVLHVDSLALYPALEQAGFVKVFPLSDPAVEDFWVLQKN